MIYFGSKRFLPFWLITLPPEGQNRLKSPYFAVSLSFGNMI